MLPRRSSSVFGPGLALLFCTAQLGLALAPVRAQNRVFPRPSPRELASHRLTPREYLANRLAHQPIAHQAVASQMSLAALRDRFSLPRHTVSPRLHAPKTARLRNTSARVAPVRLASARWDAGSIYRAAPPAALRGAGRSATRSASRNGTRGVTRISRRGVEPSEELCPVVIPAPDLKSAPFGGALLTPGDGGAGAAASIALGVYFYQDGQAAPGDEGAIEAYRARAGRMPAVWMIFQGWTGWNGFPIQQARRARQLGSQLLVTWEPWNSQGRSAPGWNCAAVASGAQDAYIRRYARAVRASGVPVMIRFAHEMNGDWYPWGTAYKSHLLRHNGNAPADYVAMWRHVVDLFREEGALNASWVWAPNIQYLNGYNSERDQKTDLAALFPGDGYVDWIGLSVYNDASKRGWRTFSDLFGTSYTALSRLSKRPMMIAEIGVTEAGAPRGTSKAAWISQALSRDIPTRFPRVKLVNWFCRDKSMMGEANYRFDSSPGALQAFRSAINSPLYGGRISQD